MFAWWKERWRIKRTWQDDSHGAAKHEALNFLWRLRRNCQCNRNANMLGGAEVVLERSYLELADLNPQIPSEPGIVPELLDRVAPVHEVVP
jgi:hypothetical protein